MTELVGEGFVMTASGCDEGRKMKREGKKGKGVVTTSLVGNS